MEALQVIIIAGILVEAVISAIKPLWDEDTRHLSYSIVGSVILAISICVTADIEIFCYFGVKVEPVIFDRILSGIIISRGSTILHDLFNRIAGVTPSSINIKQENTDENN